MEDLTNGIKEVRVQCGRMPFLSQPGSIRRVHSVETRGPYLTKVRHRRQASKNERYSPTLEEVEGEEEVVDGQYSSAFSLSSSMEHRESDATSLSDSMGSSLFSSVSSLPMSGLSRKDSNQNMRIPSIRTQRPSSVSELLERNLSPTPIPELPESPTLSRSNTPMFFATYSPRARPRSNTSFSSFRNIYHRSPSKLRSVPSLASSEQSLLHSGSRASPRSPSLRKAVKSATDMRGGSSTSSPSHKKRNPEIQQSHKDRQLSYFRRNSLTDDSFKESALSATDDECELKGSADTLSQGSIATDNDAPTKGNGKSLILRRSSLTGQIEHVTNLRAQVRRNSSFNTPAETKNVPFHGRWSMACSQGSIKGISRTVARQSSSTSNVASSSRKSRVILLESKETTV